MPETFRELPVLPFVAMKDWLRWLAKNFERQDGVWIKFAKKKSGIATITYAEAREGALIYGWIDGQKFGWDDDYYLIRITPRRKRSKWSKINREIIEHLIATKKMKPSGLKQVTEAKEDGRWDSAYDSPSTIKVPQELQTLLDGNKKARANFARLSSSNRYAFLYRIQNAKRAETKTRHVLKAFEMLKKGEVYHPELRKKQKTKKAASAKGTKQVKRASKKAKKKK